MLELVEMQQIAKALEAPRALKVHRSGSTLFRRAENQPKREFAVFTTNPIRGIRNTRETSPAAIKTPYFPPHLSTSYKAKSAAASTLFSSFHNSCKLLFTMQSAVRLSTPPPPDALAPRKRSLSRSPSPVRRVREFPLQDVDPNRASDRRRQIADRSIPKARPATPPKPKTEEEKQAIAKAEYEKLLNMRSGGTYIPPAKLRALQAQITDKTSKEYQRMAWEALKV